MDDRLFWLTQDLADVPDHDDWLSEGERRRVADMRFPKRRNDWKLGRWTAKQAICAYPLGTPPSMSTLEIRAAADGAPEVFLQGAPGPFSISISHSRDRGFCIIGPRELTVGCDLELIEERADSFFEDYFTPEEISFCKLAPPAMRPFTDYLIWSAKETALKILREGLRRDTRSVRIHADHWAREDAWNEWTGHCLESSRVFHGWWRACDDFIYTIGSDRPTHTPEELRIS
jgi:4'-phosphopantetheinyl transferase